MNISIFLGDITEAPAEVICTSTNPRLSLMMGTGGTVRERGGWEILRACEAIVGASPRGSLPAGSAHVTTAGTLPYKAVIHCVAGDRSHRSSEPIIRTCVRNALAKADQIGCSTLAMPVFGTGHARIKFDRALRAMVQTLRQATTTVQQVIIVVYDRDRAEEARRIIAE